MRDNFKDEVFTKLAAEGLAAINSTQTQMLLALNRKTASNYSGTVAPQEKLKRCKATKAQRAARKRSRNA